MDSQARIAAFQSDLDQYRRHSILPGPEEILESALRHKVPARETLSALYRALTYLRNPQDLEPLLEFFDEFSRATGAHDVLEIANIPCLLSAYVAENEDKRLTVVHRERIIGEILTRIFPGNVGWEVDLPEINIACRFDIIVVQEFQGVGRALLRTCQTIANDLVPRLSPKGFLFWLTGSAVISTRQGREILASVSQLNVWATIDIPTGIFGSSVAGCLVVLRREPVAKRLAARLRDVNTAKDVAKSFAAGPTARRAPTWEWLDVRDWRTFSMLEAERQLRGLLPRGSSIWSHYGTSSRVSAQ